MKEDRSYTVVEAADRLGISAHRARQLISTGKLASAMVGARRYVPDQAIAEYKAADRARREDLLAAAPTDWDWEGNLVETLAAWLKQQGWHELSRASAALREHGVDLVVEKDGRTQVIEVKGWRSTMGRNYLGDHVLSAMVLRSSRPDDEVAIAVPDRETFVSLLDRIRSSLETLGIGAYVIDERGKVTPFLSVEDVDHGRHARDQAIDRALVRRLVEMSDVDREAHFIASNQAALEMLADARRGQ